MQRSSKNYGLCNPNYSCSAYITAGCIGCSGGDDANIIFSKPDQVTGLRAEGGDGNVALFWDKMRGATSYRIYMDEDEPREMSGEGNNNNEMNFQVNELDNGQMYSFQVSGVNERGEGPKSDVVRMMPRPEELSVIKTIDNSKFGDQEVVLEWGKVENATAYRIYRLGPSDDEYNAATQGDITGQPLATADTVTYTDSGLTNGKYYLYQIEPIMEIPGEEPVLGERISFTGRPLGDLDQRPTLASRVDNSNDLACSIDLVINSPSQGALNISEELKGYKIAVQEVGSDSDPEEIYVSTSNRNPTRHSVDGLSYSKSYQIIVVATKAMNLAGVTEQEEEFQQETPQFGCERKPLTQPNPPTVMASDAQSLQVSWSRDPRATHYKIIRYDANGVERTPPLTEQAIAALGGASCCSYQDTGLTKDTLYGYAIQAFVRSDDSTVLESPPSPIYNVSIDTTPLKPLFQDFIPATGGKFLLTSESRIMIQSSDQSLTQELSDVLNAPRGWLGKLRYATGLSLSLVTSGSPTNRDIVLSNSPDGSFNALTTNAELIISSFDGTETVKKNIGHNVANEGYQYQVGATGAVFKFRKMWGALRAVQFITQILMQDGRPAGQHRSLPYGKGIDYPKYESRRIMLDVARQFISVEQIIGYMEKMSQHRLNELQMHINDDAKAPSDSLAKGYFRLDIGDTTRQSKMTPDGKFYTKADWDKLERAAKRYGIKIIPEFDSPGHSMAWIEDDSTLEHTLVNSDRGNRGRLKVDTSEQRKKVSNYMATMILNFRDWFQGDTIHIGGDERDVNWANDVTYLNLLYSKIKKSETVENGFEHVEIWQDTRYIEDTTTIKFSVADVHSDIDLVPWIGDDLSENASRSSRNIDMYCYTFYFVPLINWFVRKGTQPSTVYGTSDSPCTSNCRLQSNSKYFLERVTKYIEHEIIPDGLAMANWNDVTLSRSLGVDYINAGMSQNFATLGFLSWYGHVVRDSDNQIIPYADLGYDNLRPVSQELLSYWVRDRFPYLNAEQAKALLLNTARHQKIKLVNNPSAGSQGWRHNDKLVDGSASEDWMAWDVKDMAKAFKGPTKFSSEWYIVDMPGEGKMNTSGQTCVDIAFSLKERESSACEQDSWSNVISGSGGLHKKGMGSLELVADNTFTGGLQLDNGTIIVSKVANLGMGATPLILNGGTLRFKISSGNTSLDRTISGSGTILKNGSGTLTLGSLTAFTGKIEVNEGTLIVTGNLGTNNIVVSQGATYQPPS